MLSPGRRLASSHAGEEWADVERDIIHCTRCPLSRTRTLAVPGQGLAEAGLMFVGEAPGGQEDLQGLAFVGPAGRLLSELLEGIGMKREDVFITNILKCRPPGNRNPDVLEIERCLPYLRRQVSLIRPSVICTLGSFAFRSLVDDSASISRVHGQFFRKGSFEFFASYHPAHALRNPPLVEVMQRDFAVLAEKWSRVNGNHHQS